MTTISMYFVNASTTQSLTVKSGNVYTPNSGGLITGVVQGDVVDLISLGCSFSPDTATGINNFSATTGPTTGADNTEGYAVGSVWLDITNNNLYTCFGASTGAAVWEETVTIDRTQTITGNKTFSGTVAHTSTTTFTGGAVAFGASGTAGEVDIYPTTASKGFLKLVAAANTGNTNVTVTNAAMAQASVISIPDPGNATANFLLSQGAATVVGAQTYTGGVTLTTTALTLTNVNVVLNSTTGTQFGTATTQKLSFYGKTPIVQPTTTGTTTGFTAGSGTTVVSGSTFTGNTGASAYTIGDIVNALKLLGIMAA